MTIGFVGAVTDELPSLVSPAGIADITVGDPTEAANRVADQLSDGNDENGEADIVVLLVHEGAATTASRRRSTRPRASARSCSAPNDNVDAIVSGHTHLAYNHVINGPPGDLERPVRRAVLARWTSSTTRQTKSFTMKNEIFNLMDGTTPLYPDDPAVKPIVDEAVEVANELGSVVLGTATADFGRAVASSPVAGQSLPENRGGESTLGNLVADVQLLVAQRGRHARRGHRVHEPGRPARRPGLGRGHAIVRRPTCSRSRTRW